jgi:hypothetical protein
MRLKSADQSMITDVSRLRLHRCTIITSITSNADRGEDAELRVRRLTRDIRARCRSAAARLPPRRVRDESTFPPEILLLGAKHSQDVKCLALGQAKRSSPHSVDNGGARHVYELAVGVCVALRQTPPRRGAGRKKANNGIYSLRCPIGNVLL